MDKNYASLITGLLLPYLMQFYSLVDKYEGEEPEDSQQPGYRWYVTDVENAVRGGVMPEEAGSSCYGNTQDRSECEKKKKPCISLKCK